MGIFSKDTETELQSQLEKRKAELSLRELELHAQIMHKPYGKSELATKRQKISTELSHIQSQLDTLNEKSALPKLVRLIKQNLHTLRLSINNNRVQITEKLDVEIRFEGCNHVLKMPIHEVLRHQSTLKTNQQLLSAWEINLNNDYETVRSFLCDECMAEKRKKLEKDWLYQPKKRTGSATVRIEIFK